MTGTIFKKIALFTLITISVGSLYQNCSKVNFESAALSSLEGVTEASDNFCQENPQAPECLNAPPPVCQFNGEPVPEGSSVQAFQNSSVANSEACISEQRTCQNGILSGSFNYSSCSKNAPRSCLFNGQSIASGSSIEAFQNSSVLFGFTCTSENRTCNDGQLSGSFQFSTCSVGAPVACLFNGRTIAHGSSVNAFSTGSVNFGSSCINQTRSCMNGNLSGSFQFDSCSAAAPQPCLFAGQTLAHGQSVQAFAASTVAFGQTCQTNTRTCSNGTLSGTGAHASCVVGAPANCLLNGTPINHNSSLLAFETSNPPKGQACKSQNRVCTNGSLSGTYQALSCEADLSEVTKIKVTATKTYAPFKLLMIIDDSYTMLQSQAKLAANIGSLLEPLRGRNASVKVITTSDAELMNPTVLGKVTSNSRESFYAEPIGRSFELSSADSSNLTSEKITALADYVRAIGVNGRSSEQAFCPILRMMHNPSTVNKFVNITDSLAVVVITDENDSYNATSQAHCNAGLNIENLPEETVVRYTFEYKNMEIRWKHKIIRDGVVTDTLETKTERVRIGDYDFSGDALGNCVGATQTEARKLVSLKENDPRFPGIIYDGCRIFNQRLERQLLGANNTALDYCNTANTWVHNNITHNVDTWSAADKTYQRGTCRKETSKRIPTSIATVRYPGLTKSTDLIEDATLGFIRANFPAGKFFMTVIANKTGSTCLGTGHRIGQRYLDAERKYPSLVEVQSICENSYAPALARISQFGEEQSVAAKYQLQIPSANKVLQVSLVRDGKTAVLSSDKYAVTATKELQMFYSLEAGDEILVKHSP